MATGSHNPLEQYVADFRTLAQGLTGEPQEITTLRHRAIARFSERGLPSRQEEEWRFTDISPLVETHFLPAALSGNGTAPMRAEVETHAFPGTVRLVFAGGHFLPALSDTADLPAGMVAASLAQTLAATPEQIVPHLGHYAALDHPFVALNTALWRDGCFIYVPPGVVAPLLHLLFVGTSPGKPAVAYPRNLIVADEGSQLTVIESYLGPAEQYFTCAVTEVVTAANASVDHYKLTEEADTAYHMGSLVTHLGHDSRFSSHSISTGGALVRHDVGALLDGQGVDCVLNGLYLATDRQVVDNHMLVQHRQPHGTSHELYKGILDGASRAVFNGRIYVHPGAQKTDAVQSNRNLLLSDEALVNSNPQLEIFADDVRCTHGSTVGHLDQDALFYLRSRGLDAAAARTLLVYAFAAEVLEHIRLDVVRRHTEQFLATHLPGGQLLLDILTDEEHGS